MTTNPAPVDPHARADIAPATENVQVVLERLGEPDGFALATGPVPTPGPGQVRVRVLAASVQFTDTLIRRGLYPEVRDKPPLTLGYDVVGEIDAVGPGVTGLAPGDRVADLTVIGSYARYRLLEADRVVPVARALDPAEAVTMVLSYMTAYQLLHRHAQARAGQKALVQGAAGAVGLALLELGRLHGLELVGSARPASFDLVRSYGATPLDYGEDYAAALPDGVDIVFDGIGERGYRRSWPLVRKGGMLSAYGFSAMAKDGSGLLNFAAAFGRLALWNLLPNGKRAGFYGITRMRKQHPDWFRADLEALFGLLGQGKLRPRIGERLPLTAEAVTEAHRRLDTGGRHGALVLLPDAG
jgi:NADPH2:quinone reductase